MAEETFFMQTIEKSARACKMIFTLILIFVLPDFAVKAGFLSFISTLKYVRILITVLIGEYEHAFTCNLIYKYHLKFKLSIFPILLGANNVIPWQQKLKSVQSYLYSKINCDSLGFLVHSIFLLLCIRPTALF